MLAQTLLFLIGILLIGGFLGALGMYFLFNSLTKEFLDKPLYRYLKEYQSNQTHIEFIKWLKENHYTTIDMYNHYILYCLIATITIAILLIIIAFC